MLRLQRKVKNWMQYITFYIPFLHLTAQYCTEHFPIDFFIGGCSKLAGGCAGVGMWGCHCALCEVMDLSSRFLSTLQGAYWARKWICVISISFHKSPAGKPVLGSRISISVGWNYRKLNCGIKMCLLLESLNPPFVHWEYVGNLIFIKPLLTFVISFYTPAQLIFTFHEICMMLLILVNVFIAVLL